MSRVIVIIPTYNEVENLPLIVSEVLAQDDRIEILVVDDNSPDGTGKVADDLLPHPGPRGRGTAGVVRFQYRDGCSALALFRV